MQKHVLRNQKQISESVHIYAAHVLLAALSQDDQHTRRLHVAFWYVHRLEGNDMVAPLIEAHVFTTYIQQHSSLQPPKNNKINLFHKDQLRKPRNLKVLPLD